MLPKIIGKLHGEGARGARHGHQVGRRPHSRQPFHRHHLGTQSPLLFLSFKPAEFSFQYPIVVSFGHTLLYIPVNVTMMQCDSLSLLHPGKNIGFSLSKIVYGEKIF